MPLKRVNESPAATDVVLFDILTPGFDGCLADPYKVDRVTVYFIERNFALGSPRLFSKVEIDPDRDAEAAAAEQVACATPTEENVAAARGLRSRADATRRAVDTYFTDAIPTLVVGDSLNPAWLSTDAANSPLYHELGTFGDGLDGLPVLLDPLTGAESPTPGHFLLQWDNRGASREGDYLVCWTWTPLPAGDSLAAHTPFTIEGNTQVTQSIPTHFTVPGKYETLLDRYLPEMFKMTLCPTDLTPVVLERLHRSIALGYTSLENLANQIIDLLDSNSIHGVLLPYLSNLFNLKLKSGDPTLWRRQVKRAIPLYKRKGTIGGLREALAQAGIGFAKLTRLFQVVSPYTWTDAFFGSQESFRTTYAPTDPAPADDANNYAVSVLSGGEETARGASSVSWGDDGVTLAFAGDLGDADVLLVTYEVTPPPGGTEQTIETYIRSLPLADQRTGLGAGAYPLKNWNVRVIEEDDPLFALICASTDEFHEDIVFGHVRTEFPYSENIYNMDEYNGSSRCSTDPCDIGKEFLDACSCCLSSKFNLDVAIASLCDDRIVECQEVVSEFAPFHARLHMLGLSGLVDEYAKPAIESVDSLVRYKVEEFVLAGNANPYFNRARGTGLGSVTGPPPEGDDPDDPAYLNDVRRGMLARSTTVVSEYPGTAYNGGVYLFSPGVRLDRLGLSPVNLLEITGSAPNNGSYVVDSPEGNTVRVAGAHEPLDAAEFVFRLSNFVYENAATVLQDDVFHFSDPAIDLGVADAGWKVHIPAYSSTPFAVLGVRTNAVLVLADPDRLLPTTTTTGITYFLLDPSDEVVAIASGPVPGDPDVPQAHGVLQATRRGRVVVHDGVILDLRAVLEIGDYALLLGTQYRVGGFVEGADDSFYVDTYASGDASGVGLVVYRRLLDSQVGTLDYRGLFLDAIIDHESGRLIQDGSGNPTDPDQRLESTVPGEPSFKANFLVLIDEDYYLITDIDRGIITLSGPPNAWGTAPSGGTSVSYSLLQFSNATTNLSGTGDTLNVDGHEFQFLDRRGNDDVETVIVERPQDAPLAALAATAFNAKKVDSVRDAVAHSEAVSFTIKYASETAEHGEI